MLKTSYGNNQNSKNNQINKTHKNNILKDFIEAFNTDSKVAIQKQKDKFNQTFAKDIVHKLKEVSVATDANKSSSTNLRSKNQTPNNADLEFDIIEENKNEVTEIGSPASGDGYNYI